MASIPPITSSSTSTLHETEARACGKANMMIVNPKRHLPTPGQHGHKDSLNGRTHTMTHPMLLLISILRLLIKGLYKLGVA